MGWFRRSTPVPPVEFGCDYCANDDNRYYEHVTRIGFDDFRGLRLLRCPRCEALYEETSNGEQTRRLTRAEAKTRFAGSALEVDEQGAGWHRVHAFTDDPDHIVQLQKVSRDKSDFGLAPKPLVGSDEWWSAIDDGVLANSEIEGVIDSVFWGSMNDWPEFRVRDANGEVTNWTREGEYRRYVEGLRVRIRTVTHEWKRPDAVMSTGPRQLVLSIDIEDSKRRAAAIAPGPGGAGYDLARREGAVLHFMVPASDFADVDRLRAAVVELGGQLQEFGKGPRRACRATFDSADDALEQKTQLLAIGDGLDYVYDGGEIVGGDVLDA